MTTSNKAIEVTSVAFSYGGTPTLENVSFTLEIGGSLGIVGPNGGGKTTLLKLMLGLLVPDKGEIRIFGQPPGEARKQIGYVPQYVDFDRSFPVTALDVVLMGRLGLTRLLGSYRQEDRRLAQQAMEQVGVWHLKQRRLGSLSEGQRQRVLLARALVTEPRLLVLDEPTASVDPVAEQEIMRLLGEMRENMTVIMVSHDLELLTSCVSRLVYVNRQVAPNKRDQIPGESLFLR